MTTFLAYVVPAVLLAFTAPWSLRMLRSTSTEPALNRIGQLASLTALVALGAVVFRFDLVPAWTWYPSALAVGVGAVALCLRWPVLVEPGPPIRRVGTIVSLVLNASLLVLVMYASLR